MVTCRSVTPTCWSTEQRTPAKLGGLKRTVTMLALSRFFLGWDWRRRRLPWSQYRPTFSGESRCAVRRPVQLRDMAGEGSPRGNARCPGSLSACWLPTHHLTAPAKQSASPLAWWVGLHQEPAMVKDLYAPALQHHCPRARRTASSSSAGVAQSTRAARLSDVPTTTRIRQNANQCASCAHAWSLSESTARRRERGAASCGVTMLRSTLGAFPDSGQRRKVIERGPLSLPPYGRAAHQ